MRSMIAVGIAVLTTGALAFAGCGSGGTKTVSVSSATGTSAAGAVTSTVGRPSSPSAGKTEPGQGTPAQSTRTATAPAFTKEPSGGEGLGSAVAVIKAHGYTPEDTTSYHANQTLRVLLATRTGSADGYAQQAFFFVGSRYIGTDTSTPSAGIRLVSQGDTEATLAYRLYRPGDPLCCARGGEATVRFQLNNGRLVALDSIPPVSSQTGASRQ